MVDDDRLPLLARRDAADAQGALPHARLLSADAARSSPTRPTLDDIIAEMQASTTSERQGRLIDTDEAGSMEKKKREGYF